MGVNRITALDENVTPTEIGQQKPQTNSELNENLSSANQNTSSRSQSYIKAVYPQLRDCTFIEGIKYFLEGRFPGVLKGNSMLPSLRSNYMVMDKNVSFSDLKIGDVIQFSARDEDMVVEHRIIYIDENMNGERVLVTQGDNNTNPICGIDSPITEHNYISKDELYVE